jgi:hypothetical protein
MRRFPGRRTRTTAPPTVSARQSRVHVSRIVSGTIPGQAGAVTMIRPLPDDDAEEAP